MDALAELVTGATPAGAKRRDGLSICPPRGACGAIQMSVVW